MIYHDESIFCTNEAQTWMWGEADKPVILPKTKGSGIMVYVNILGRPGIMRWLTEKVIMLVMRLNRRLKYTSRTVEFFLNMTNFI